MLLFQGRTRAQFTRTKGKDVTLPNADAAMTALAEDRPRPQGGLTLVDWLTP